MSSSVEAQRVDASGFFIDHGTGVVIGETSLIGERVRLYQGVTLGARSFASDEQGHLVKGLLRHPIVEDDVVIYAGATIFGRIILGKGATTGCNVWLTQRAAGQSGHTGPGSSGDWLTIENQAESVVTDVERTASTRSCRGRYRSTETSTMWRRAGS